jgi:hypothetical protein
MPEVKGHFFKLFSMIDDSQEECMMKAYSLIETRLDVSSMVLLLVFKSDLCQFCVKCHSRVGDHLSMSDK